MKKNKEIEKTENKKVYWKCYNCEFDFNVLGNESCNRCGWAFKFNEHKRKQKEELIKQQAVIENNKN